jgi:hypothetical protein
MSHLVSDPQRLGEDTDRGKVHPSWRALMTGSNSALVRLLVTSGHAHRLDVGVPRVVHTRLDHLYQSC